MADQVALGVAIAGARFILARRHKRKASRRKSRVWVQPWIQKQQLLGHFETLIQELSEEDV